MAVYPNSARSGYSAPEVTDLASAESDSAIVADVARRAEAAGAIDDVAVHETGLVVRLHRNDEVVSTIDLEKFLTDPRSCRGGATHTDPVGFADYVKRLADARTSVWADVDRSRIVAVMNDHGPGNDAGWRDHRVTLRADVDPAWNAWAEKSNRLGTQEWFAEFVEEHFADIDGTEPGTPTAADMLEVAQTFNARKSSTFDRAIRLQNGDVQMRWSEQTTATAGTGKGTFEVPPEFWVRLAPYRGVDPVRVKAFLRYRIRDGVLSVGYQLHRADDVLRKAFESLTATVATGLDGAAPVYLGPAPDALR